MTDTDPSLRPSPAALDRVKPTSLKPVLDVIPERCYERSTFRGLSILARDVVVLGLAIWGLLSTNNPLLLVPLWLVAGLATSGLFVVGHDAAHGALFDSGRLNAIVARVAMLPSLHATEQWVFGHNRVHHGHTLRQGMDFVWHPLTVGDYQQLGRFSRLRHRFEWGPFGSGAYYLREVWWNKMIRFPPPERWRRAMRRDQAILLIYTVAVFAALWAGFGLGGAAWQWTKIVVVPFVLFCQSIGWVVYVHHIAPEIRWWPRREWNRFRGQVEGTTILWGSWLWELFFHWIMVHIPHHVDMRIPCYRLPAAARAIAAAFPEDVVERPIRLRDFLRSVRVCKLHDFESGRWLPYPTRS
ncbi:MAG: fatty acid desaturase [Actinomycetia bacterium]|nr:fatty acid desaturase [Actinomycetes bacterium]